MYKQDNGGVESLLDQRKELLEELINSDIIDEEHGYYDDVKGAIESNDSEQMREIIDELLSSGFIYKDDWDYKLARKLSKESKKMVNGGGVGNYKEKNETMDKMGKFAEGSTEMLKVELANNIRTQRGMNKMMLENDMPKAYVGSAMKLQARAEDLVKELKHRDVNIDSILYKDYDKYRTGGSIENQYKDKTPKEIWSEWSIEQKSHFLKDHFLTNTDYSEDKKEQLREAKYLNWDDLPSALQMEVERHIFMGQYAVGGEVYSDSKWLTKNQWEKWNKYVKTGKIDDKKENNIFAVARWIGVPVESINAYEIEKRDKMNKYAVGGEIGNQVTFSRYGERTTGKIIDKVRNGYEVVTNEGTILVEPQEVISFSEAPMEKKKRFGFFENGGGVGDWSGKNFNKYFSTEEAESMIETLKDSDEIKGFDVASMNDNGSKITVINAYTDRESSVNPWNLEMGKGEKWRFFIIPLKPMVELPKQVLAEIEGGGDKYKRGGFIYEVQKKGSPSNDMRETMFTAKNLTELKKQIIEKYGTSEGFLVSRRTDKGYYASVKFEGGGEIQSKIDKLNKVVNSKMLPEGAKTKAKAEIERLEKQLQADSVLKKSESYHEEGKDVYGDSFYQWHNISMDGDQDIFAYSTPKGTVIYGEDSEGEKDFSASFTTEPYYLEEAPEEDYSFNTLKESKVKALELLKTKKLGRDSKETKAEEKSEHKTGGYESKEKVGVSKIKILWAEGDNSKFDKFPKNYSSWALANKAIIPVYEDTIGNEGYNKVKFSVIFKDGETYDGRLDVSEREDNPIKSNNVIGQHIKDYLDYMSSEKSVSSEDDKKEIKEWLEKYDLGLSGGSEAKKPKFKIGDVVGLDLDERTPKMITSFKTNRKGEIIYSGYYIPFPDQKWNYEESEIVLLKAPSKPTTRKAPVKKAADKKTEVKKEVETENDNKKRFELIFYYGSNTRNYDKKGKLLEPTELIIRANDLENAISQSIKKAKDLNAKNFEIYYKDLFVGSVDLMKSNDFIKGRGYNDFIKGEKPKPDHKKLLAKIKAKKGDKEYDNKASLNPETGERRKRSESSDKKREALPLGKRVSASGNKYYENRLNRGDISKEDKFEEGGEVKSSGWGLKFLKW